MSIERRVHARLDPVTGSTVYCCHGTRGQSLNFAIDLINVGTGGACLVLTSRLALADPVTITLVVPDGSAAHTLTGQVVWVRTFDPAYHLTGVRFDTLLDPAALLALARPNPQ